MGKYFLFSKRKSFIAVKALSCSAEIKLVGKGNLHWDAAEDDLREHALAYEIKQKTEKDSRNDVG